MNFKNEIYLEKNEISYFFMRIIFNNIVKKTDRFEQKSTSFNHNYSEINARQYAL